MVEKTPSPLEGEGGVGVAHALPRAGSAYFCALTMAK